MLNRSASLAISTSILKALPGKLDIKRHICINPCLFWLLRVLKKVLIQINWLLKISEILQVKWIITDECSTQKTLHDVRPIGANIKDI